MRHVCLFLTSSSLAFVLFDLILEESFCVLRVLVVVIAKPKQTIPVDLLFYRPVAIGFSSLWRLLYDHLSSAQLSRRVMIPS